MANIRCKCGSVRLEFPVAAELFRHQCVCHDCISGLWYTTQRGGPQYPLGLCADTCWLPNDFRILSGEDKIGAFLNFESGDSTRFHCTSCWTMLFQSHALYEGRILASQVASYECFEGLTNIERMGPQARHFLKDRTPEQLDLLPPWHGDPDRLYQGPAQVLLDNFPAMRAAGSEGAEMNAQILLGRIGNVLIPKDEPRLFTGPPSLMQQLAAQENEAT